MAVSSPIPMDKYRGRHMLMEAQGASGSKGEEADVSRK